MCYTASSLIQLLVFPLSTSFDPYIISIMILITSWFASSFVKVKLSKHLYMLYLHVTAYVNPNLVKLQKNCTTPLHVKAPGSEDR
jgi:hypothetical protein